MILDYGFGTMTATTYSILKTVLTISISQPFIPQFLIKKLRDIINQCFFHKNGIRRFQYVVFGYTYFVQGHSDEPQNTLMQS